MDGRIGQGTDTINAIKQFQREAMGRANPDGRVDPPGADPRKIMTFTFLTMYITTAQEAAIKKQVSEGQMVGGAPVVSHKTIAAAAGLTGLSVIYDPTHVCADNQIVSDYSMRVIKIALKEAGLKVGVITSTIRTPERQAAIMLKNAKENLTKQYELYGNQGDKVLKVYAVNKSKPDSEVLKLMVAKIEELAKNDIRVSKHCVPKEVYLKRNVIDIGLGGMVKHNPGLDRQKFTAVLTKLEKEGYLEVLIDETELTNKCWHIEIIVNKMASAKYEANTILNTVAYC